VVLEAASRAGWHDDAGRLAYDICRRVYAENDRRDLSVHERPLPGVAREYWPSDLSTWDASEGYGWGAQTASYVIRQLCGFYEAEDTNGCAFRLAPGLPPELIAGKTLGIGPLPYRGRLLWLTYRDAADGSLEIEVRLDQAARLVARDETSGEELLDAAPSTVHNFRLALGCSARIDVSIAVSAIARTVTGRECWLR